MKRYSISYDMYGCIYHINAYKHVEEMTDSHKPESGLCLINAVSLMEALEKYKSMTGNAVI